MNDDERVMILERGLITQRVLKKEGYTDLENELSELMTNVANHYFMFDYLTAKQLVVAIEMEMMERMKNIFI
jgi:hypothetical protein